MSKTKKVLYLGLNPPQDTEERRFIHYPVIQIVPMPPFSPDIVSALKNFPSYTHVILTSKSSGKILCDILPHYGFSLSDFQQKQIIAVGQATTTFLRCHGMENIVTARRETAEGVVEELKKVVATSYHFFWPHSTLSRPTISTFLKQSQIPFSECILYNTIPRKSQPLPNLHDIDELFFTSPSTVDAFLKIFGIIPLEKGIITQGPVTADYLTKRIKGHHDDNYTHPS